MTDINFIFADHGSVCLVQGQTQSDVQWLRSHVDPEAQWLGSALAVEHRYAMPLALDLQREGYVCVFGPKTP